MTVLCTPYPLQEMRIQVTTAEGISLWKPMWLIMMGQRRDELTTTEGYQAYRQRYDTLTSTAF